MITAVTVVGARPNFMKAAPIQQAMRRHGGFHPVLVHTGQHYDSAMSDGLFRDLGLSPPDVFLGVGSGTHAEQTARIMLQLEPVLLKTVPHVVLVVGDVNSTLAGAVTAAKLNLPVAHVEAGLRSGDRAMPEEINRIVADALSELLFAPSQDAVENLLREGVPKQRIHFVGNVMIDSLMACLEQAERSTVVTDLGLEPRRYFVSTVHRPSNVDNDDDLATVVDILLEVATLHPIVLAAHPRTARRLTATGMADRLSAGGVRVIPPLGYLDFLQLMVRSAAVLTDSGGVQEESAVLGVPCITLRDRTERPITVERGTNTVTGLQLDAVMTAAGKALDNERRPVAPELWDGQTAERIIGVLQKAFE